MESTSPRELREMFVTAIKGIRPTHPDYRDEPWRYVPKRGEVPGSTLRNFTITFGIATEVQDGIYGHGIQKEMEMLVWTNYMHLGSDQDDSIISEDNHDLFVTLSDLAESSGCGLIAIRDPDWDDEEDDEGHRWGAHLFTVHFLAPDPLP